LIFLNLRLGWIREVGPTIGSAFILLFAKPLRFQKYSSVEIV